VYWPRWGISIWFPHHHKYKSFLSPFEIAKKYNEKVGKMIGQAARI